MSRLLIVGGLVVLVLFVLGCLGVVAWVMNRAVGDRPASEEAVHEAQTTLFSFFEDIQSGQLEDAYARTSKSYQNQYTLEQFQQWVGRQPQLKTERATLKARAGGKARSVAFEVTLARLQLTVTMVKEDDEWKVEAIRSS